MGQPATLAARASDRRVPCGTVVVTKLAADQRCDRCDGLLVPPHVIGSAFKTLADYVCATCAKPFHWVGDPPILEGFLIDTTDKKARAPNDE